MKIILLVGILFLVFVNIFASKVKIYYARLEQPSTNSCLDRLHKIILEPPKSRSRSCKLISYLNFQIREAAKILAIDATRLAIVDLIIQYVIQEQKLAYATRTFRPPIISISVGSVSLEIHAKFYL
jgi:hypothetical protein